MGISSLNTATADTMSSSNAQAALATGEKLQKTAKKAGQPMDMDTVEISDDAQTMFAKMKSKKEDLAVNARADNESASPDMEVSEVAQEANGKDGEAQKTYGQGGMVDDSGVDGPSAEDLKKKIDKLKQELKRLTAKEGSENDGYIQNKIRSIKSKIASYKAKQES